jgi:hypothetical protein
MERVCEKLRAHLTVLMGLDGFTLLLIRSFTLAVAEFPWMESLPAKKDGSLACTHASMSHQAPPELLAGFITVLTAFFGQLFAFIGEPLTLRLLQDIWPELMLSDQGLVEEETIC